MAPSVENSRDQSPQVAGLQVAGLQLAGRLSAVDLADQNAVPKHVDGILALARSVFASDVHIVPEASRYVLRFRVDGVLLPVTHYPTEVGLRIVTRLKVMAQLLTYRSDVPQEGRCAGEPGAAETRISVFPTLFGEKAVARLFAPAVTYQHIDQLGLPSDVRHELSQQLDRTAGVVLVTGPAGSGKTTTLYTCLRELAARTAGSRSLVSLEDPVEMVLQGVSQTQLSANGDFNLAAALRAVLRQDPEVIMVGEIRDAATAATVFQAALSGHLVLTSFHAGSAATAINRLCDMGIEPYLLRSTVLSIISQRLLRRRCVCKNDAPANTIGAQAAIAGSNHSSNSGGHCARCQGSGYAGRAVIAEMLLPQVSSVARGILAREDAAILEAAAVAAGMVTLRQRADEMVHRGETTLAEVLRVFGHSGE